MKARAIAYPPFWRLTAALLIVVSYGSSLAMLAALLFLDTPLRNPLSLIRIFTGLCLAPALAAWLIERAFAVTLVIENRTLVLQQRGQRVEVPCGAVERAAAWTVPLPAGGLGLRLRSGRRLGYGLQVADPVAFLEALAQAGASEAVRDASRQPGAVYARAKGEPRSWYTRVLGLVFFALVPALPLFRLHQWIAYGGTFGEYYSYGLQAYLLGFAIYWGTCIVYLALYAAVLRAAAELIALSIAIVAPARAAGARRAVELFRRVLYYVGVPLLLAMRFLA